MIRPAAIPERLGHAPEQVASRHGNFSHTSSVHNIIIEVDEHLHRLHQYGLGLQAYDQTPDYTRDIAELRHILDKTLQKIIRSNEPTSWQQYYALLNREVFIEELTYAPLVLGARNISKEQLRQFSDGVYGLNVHLLADALEHHDNMNTFDPNRKNLRGIINELTSVALLNREQKPGQLALPAHHMADAYRKTDTLFYHRTNGVPYATNIQVKSYLQDKTPELLTPPYGILISALDMSNQDNFATSRAIVAELYQESPHAHSNNRAYLQKVHATFMDHVYQRIDTNNARYEPHKTTTLGMTA